MMEVVAFMCNLGFPDSDRPDVPRCTVRSGLQEAAELPLGSDDRVCK